MNPSSPYGGKHYEIIDFCASPKQARVLTLKIKCHLFTNEHSYDNVYLHLKNRLVIASRQIERKVSNKY